jgi:hypothetical protein
MTFDELPKHIQEQWRSAKPLSGGERVVRTFNGIGAKPGGELMRSMSESSFLENAHLRLEINRGGRFTPEDVAAILATTQKWGEQTQREFLWHLHRDIRAGRICIIKDAHKLERNCAIDGDKHSDAHDLLSAKEISRWLESQNAPYKFTTENFSDAPTSSPATTAPVLPDDVDMTMVATRKELIDAFGKFTGMDATWFDNLNTSPKLKAARKFTGKGGRHSAEPLFCPYLVTQWMADPKRRKGKPLGDTTAWRLLKSYFPKVYNQYSIGDPNPV